MPITASPVLIFSFVGRISKFLNSFFPALYRASVDAVVFRELLRYSGIYKNVSSRTFELLLYCFIRPYKFIVICLVCSSDQFFRVISLAWRDSETRSVTDRQTDGVRQTTERETLRKLNNEKLDY